jgi:hypothetical protein
MIVLFPPAFMPGMWTSAPDEPACCGCEMGSLS